MLISISEYYMQGTFSQLSISSQNIEENFDLVIVVENPLSTDANSSYQHEFCLKCFIWETDYTINCWRHLESPQMAPADATAVKGIIGYTYEPKFELTGIKGWAKRG